jgi:hypothetical protein
VPSAEVSKAPADAEDCDEVLQDYNKLQKLQQRLKCGLY